MAAQELLSWVACDLFGRGVEQHHQALRVHAHHHHTGVLDQALQRLCGATQGGFGSMLRITGLAQAGGHVMHGAEQLPGFVIHLDDGCHIQPALGNSARHVHGVAQGLRDADIDPQCQHSPGQNAGQQQQHLRPGRAAYFQSGPGLIRIHG